MTQRTIRVMGMTCSHCERRVQEIAHSVPGTIAAKANVAMGTLHLQLSLDEKQYADYIKGLGAALANGGYPLADVADSVDQVVENRQKASATSRKQLTGKRGTALAVLVGLALCAVMVIADRAGLFSIAPSVGAAMGFSALLFAGFMTSFHCIAMCGGIALSQSLGNARPACGDSVMVRTALRRTFAYNAGRVISYTAIGAAIGAIGKGLPIGQIGRSILMGAAGLFMLASAASLAGFLRLPSLRLPFIDRLLDRAGAKAEASGPFIVGLANGLMPCGPLQAMQLYALGSGSALSGALAMFAFSAGTVPVMALSGTGAAMVKPAWRAAANKAGAVLVAFLGLSALARAWSLAGLPGSTAILARSAFASAESPARDGSARAPARSLGVEATMKDGYQEAIIDLGPRSYGDITVRAGVPVRFVIRAQGKDINGCNDAVVIPSLGIQKRIEPGDNVIEFTPSKSGIIPYSCWMGMINASILVLDQLPEGGS